MKAIAPLNWQEQTQPGEPLAPYTLDFSADPVWQFGLPSFYLGNAVNPAGVAVDLTQINTTVTVVSGPLNVTVPPYTRQNIPLPSNSLAAVFTSSGTNQVPIAFYITEPTGPWMNQYAAAQALANNNIFIGGTTTGSANAQALNVSPAATYQFGNGVVVTGRWGFSNTGPLTFSINGGPATAVEILTQNGPGACVSGEAIAGQSFILVGDSVGGVWQLVTPAPLASHAASAGYVKLHGGLLLNWNSALTDTAGQSVLWASAFQTSVFAVLASVQNANAPGYVGTVNLNGCNLFAGTGTLVQAFVLAIGS